jgi:hypothetical protein
MLLNYSRVRDLPQIVKSFCRMANAVIVGSYAQYLVTDVGERPLDIDLIVPLYRWPDAVIIIPRGARANTFGGYKLLDDEKQLLIDVWPDDFLRYIQNVPRYPALAINPFNWLVLTFDKLQLTKGGQDADQVATDSTLPDSSLYH